MPTRRKESPRPPQDVIEIDEPEEDEEEDEDEDEAEAEADSDIEPDVDAEADEEVEDDDSAVAVEDDDGAVEDDDEAAVEIVAPTRPAARPSPGRPPSAKEEPEPPFFVGERVVLVRNTRPRTGAPIGDHPVGATGRVETVLSQTAIIRFDRAADVKEVVAFTCLESLDDDAKARRAERDRQAASS